MNKKYRNSIAFFLIVVFIIVGVPASAVQSAEQSVSDSLTRGSRFTITITGLPNTPYYVWLPGTFTMTGEPYDRPPVITGGQENIVYDAPDGPYTIGSYQYNNGGGRTIRDDIAPSTSDMPNTNYYAQVTTDERGLAVVEFQTSVYTGLRSYSVKVENPEAPDNPSLLVEQKVYSRSASRPMVNTPSPTVAALQATTAPTTLPTPPPETLPVTVIPTTTPAPAPTTKSALEAGIPAIAAAISLFIMKKR